MLSQRSVRAYVNTNSTYAHFQSECLSACETSQVLNLVLTFVLFDKGDH